MSSLKIGDSISITIDRLAVGGDGVGRYQNQVVFVPFTAPGDQCLVRIRELKQKFLRATLVQIKKPSPSRREAPCSVFGQCGGCQWQHLDYTEQLRQKDQLVQYTFRKLAAPTQIKTILASPTEWNYRRRIQLHWRDETLGYLKFKSHQHIPVETCHIADNKINDALKQFQVPDSLKCSKYEIGINDSKELYILPMDDEDKPFSQVNPYTNELLLQTVTETLHKSKGLRVFDLYGGAGNFGVIIAERYPQKHVITVETQKGLATLAAEKKQQKSLNNYEVIHSNVEDYLKRTNLEFSVAIIDPPRAGCSPETVRQLLRSQPEDIIYVSCDLMTAQRDLSQFTKKYSIETIQPLDMFPQTDHLELVCHLRLGSSR